MKGRKRKRGVGVWEGGGRLTSFLTQSFDHWPRILSSRSIIDHASLLRRSRGEGGVLVSCMAVVIEP